MASRKKDGFGEGEALLRRLRRLKIRADGAGAEGPAQLIALMDDVVIPDNVSVRELEQIAFVRLAHLFWSLSRRIACDTGALRTVPVAWSGTKSTRRMYENLCEIPADIDPAELARRIRAFNDDFRAIPLTVTLHGARFRLPYLEVPRPEAPVVNVSRPATDRTRAPRKLAARTRLEPLAS